MRPPQAAASVFSGTRASYVALAAISTLAIALLSSIWESDVSGSAALLGVLSVYLASSELLVLYIIFTPASLVVDIIRLSLVPHTTAGRGWLVFFNILEMLCKAVGTMFAWSLHRSIQSGEGTYGPISGSTAVQASTYGRVEDPFAAAYAPPASDSFNHAAPSQQQQQHQQQHLPQPQPPPQQAHQQQQYGQPPAPPTFGSLGPAPALQAQQQVGGLTSVL